MRYCFKIISSCVTVAFRIYYALMLRQMHDVCASVRICVCACMHEYVHACVCACMSIHVCTRVCMCVTVYTHQTCACAVHTMIHACTCITLPSISSDGFAAVMVCLEVLMNLYNIKLSWYINMLCTTRI